jgi:hypothetical protein
MRLVVIFGPPAVGKMTVGHALATLTGMRLFHNHMTIELVLRFFNYGEPPFQRLVSEFRSRILDEVAQSTLPGLIFTFVWALDDASDRAFIERCAQPFRARGAPVHFVELEATLDERLRRNASPFRLSEKPSKRDLDQSRSNLLDTDRKHKLNSDGDFFEGSHLKIDNTTLSPEQTARLIIDVFAIPTVESPPE